MVRWVVGTGRYGARPSSSRGYKPVNLRELLSTIAHTYERAEGQQGSAAKLLRRAAEVVDGYVPKGYLVKGSSGQSTPAFVPWIAVFDPDETTSATRGLYVVYLFAADMRTIFLSLAQGTEDLRKEIKGQALSNLTAQAKAIREELQPELRAGLQDSVTLLAPSRVQRPKYYEAGTIVAKPYDVDNLPSDAELAADLQRFLRLADHAIDRRRQLALSRPDTIATSEPYRPTSNVDQFKPKNDAEYKQVIRARTLTKSRKHETLLRQFNDHLCRQGFTTGSPHPRDLVASRDGVDWLIEAKVLQHGNGVQATRDAFGQLVWYRHCYYDDPDAVRMLALFNEPVGDLAIAVLLANGVEAVWADGERWRGTPTAASSGMCTM